MESVQTLSDQKSYWLRQLQKGNITQIRYDGIMDYIELQENQIKQIKGV